MAHLNRHFFAFSLFKKITVTMLCLLFSTSTNQKINQFTHVQF